MHMLLMIIGPNLGQNISKQRHQLRPAGLMHVLTFRLLSA